MNNLAIEGNLIFENVTFEKPMKISGLSMKDSLIFRDCIFKKEINFHQLRIGTLAISNCQTGNLTIDSITVERMIIKGLNVNNTLAIQNTTFNKGFVIESNNEYFDFSDNVISIPEPTLILKHEDLFYEGSVTLNKIDLFKTKGIGVYNNQILGGGDFNIFEITLPDAYEIAFINNRINGILKLNGSTDFIHFWGNEASYFDFGQISLPEFETFIEWSNIGSKKLLNVYNLTENPEEYVENNLIEQYYDQMNFSDQFDSWLPQIYRGITHSELNSKWFYDRLLSSYYSIYIRYKSKGRLEDANAVYVELMDLHGEHLKTYFQNDKTLNSFLNWMLNRILKTYTEYGTNPVRAIVISIYVIIFFGIFYFFFPSEWDALQWNKKYFRSLGSKKFTSVALKHLLNSMTLSMNAFVTLGFGKIPSTGTPRYFCIFQGLMGWFLLSLFTVALISQTLF
ncbi:MAG: hypothetical protein ACFHWX_18540 [Bacteroidota bacterium]